MTSESKIASQPKTVAIPQTLKDRKLVEAALVYNALVAQKLVPLFPDDLSPAFVYAALTEHINEFTALGEARSDVSEAVETRRDCLKRGKDGRGKEDLAQRGFPSRIAKRKLLSQSK